MHQKGNTALHQTLIGLYSTDGVVRCDTIDVTSHHLEKTEDTPYKASETSQDVPKLASYRSQSKGLFLIPSGY
jgi:hypothetical protein